MSKKIVLSILLCVALFSASTGVAAAAPPMSDFEAAGIMLTIDEGDVSPAGVSGRFVVKERTITAFLEGNLNGIGVFTYGTNVPIATQSGSFHGTLTIGDYEAKVRGKSALGMTPIGFPGLLIDGTFAFTSGTQGRGELHAWLIPDLDDEGHVIGIIASGMTISGRWRQ